MKFWELLKQIAERSEEVLEHTFESTFRILRDADETYIDRFYVDDYGNILDEKDGNTLHLSASTIADAEVEKISQTFKFRVICTQTAEVEVKAVDEHDAAEQMDRMLSDSNFDFDDEDYDYKLIR